MSNRFETRIKKWRTYAVFLIKWLVISGVTGILCGLMGSAFHKGVEWALTLRDQHAWLLFTLPLLGLLIVTCYKLLKTEGLSTNSILEAVHSGKSLSWRLLPAIFISTILTHLGGGSAGREGAALQMGGTIGFQWGKLMKLDDKDLRTATMTGMAAFFAALFGTPLAAAIFAMAVISVGIIYHTALLPCLISSLTAYGISLLLGIEPTRFAVSVPHLDVFMLLRVAALGILCAFVSILFCKMIHGTNRMMMTYIKNPYLRVLAGSAIIIILTLVLRTDDYNGLGFDIITAAIEEGKALPAAFILKIIFTAITLGSGFKGGEVVPSFFVGATFGCFIGPLLGLPAGFAAAVGLVTVFCGAVNCPLASILLAVELFGAEGLLFYALACALSFVFSGYNGLYSSQRIMYDKLKATFINVKTNSYHEGDQMRHERDQ